MYIIGEAAAPRLIRPGERSCGRLGQRHPDTPKGLRRERHVSDDASGRQAPSAASPGGNELPLNRALLTGISSICGYEGINPIGGQGHESIGLLAPLKHD